MKTRTAVVLGLMLVIMVGCASSPEIRPHRPEFYTKSGGETTSAIAGQFGYFVGGAAEAYRLQQNALFAYPECRGLIEADLWKCVREIDIKEGRITADYVEPQRQNMDDIMARPDERLR